MRKFVVFILLICMMMSFISCNPDPATGNPGPTSRVATDDDVVLFSYLFGNLDNSYAILNDESLATQTILSGSGEIVSDTDSNNYSLAFHDLVFKDDLPGYYATFNGFHIDGTFALSGSRENCQISIDVSCSSAILGSHTAEFTISGPRVGFPVFSEVVIDGTSVTGLREALIRSAFGDVSRSVEVYKWDDVYESLGDYSYHFDFWLFHDTESDQYEIYVNERNGGYSIYDLNRENKVGPFVVDYNLTIQSNTVPLGRYLYVSDSGDSYAVTAEASYPGHSLYDSDYVAVRFTDGVVFVIEGQLYYYNWRDDDLSPIPHIGTGLIETNADAYYENDNTGSGPFYLSCPELKCTYKDGVNDVVVFFDRPS